MKLKLKEGTTSKIVTVFIQDSSSTTGAGLTDLLFNTASLTGYWIAEGDATATQITMATMTIGTWATGGFIEVDATNLPGVYQVGIPDVVIDNTSEGSVVVMYKGATNMAPCVLEIELDAIDYKDATRLGLTALPNAAADAAGGLAISDAGGLDLDALKTKLDFLPAVTAGGAGGLFIAGTNAATTITTSLTTTFTGNLTGSVGSVTGAVGSVTGAVGSVTGSVGSVTGAVGSVTGAAGSVTGAVGSVAGNVDGNVTGSVGSLVGHTVQTGDSFARIGAAGASLTDLGGMSTTMKGQVNTEADTALSDINLDHLLKVAVLGTDVIDDSVFAQLVSASATADWDDFVNTTDSLQAVRDRGDSAWITGAGGSDRLLMVDTTIATLSSQTSFTLAAGSTDDNAYVNCTIVIEDVSTSTQKAVGVISAYTGASKTVTLKYDPAIFTMATTDKVYVLAENALKSTAQNRQLDVTATGAAGIDWGNVENPTTAVDLSATDIQLVDTVTTYTGNTVQTGDSFARIGAPIGASISADLADVPTVAEFNARTLVAASYFDPAADTVALVTTVTTTTTATNLTTNNDKTGYSLVSTGADLVLVDGKTLPNALEIIASACIGIISGAGTGTEVFKGLDKTTTRSTVTVDASGNRSAITYV